MSWYTTKGSMGQGLVIDEADGRNVAVAYDEKDAPLLAAAPDLVRALRFITNAAEAEPGMQIYRAHIKLALAVLAEVEGR
ncbi:MAG TPA: hypothetical protein VMV98_07455 [Acidobacteriaceae bacterium]|nr:hypothetical protein [Acidobacteriaceae bacterium]